MMTTTTRDFIAALGRLLLEIAGEDAPAPAPAPAPAEPKPAAAPEEKPADPQPKRRYSMPPRKEIDWVCQDCGATFKTKSKLAKRCPACRYKNSIGKLGKLTAKNAGVTQPAPVPDGKIRCERMHATIPATMCGTREECHGNPLCPHLPKRGKAA